MKQPLTISMSQTTFIHEQHLLDVQKLGLASHGDAIKSVESSPNHLMFLAVFKGTDVYIVDFDNEHSKWENN